MSKGSTFVLQRYSVRVSVRTPDILTEVSSWFSLVPVDKFRGSITDKSLPDPPKILYKSSFINQPVILRYIV
jgi:hypothetical protein